MLRRRLALALLALAATRAAAQDDFDFQMSDEDYYRMPQLFALDDYEPCLAAPAGAYCLGSFELFDEGRGDLLRLMRRYSANWVDRFNHTRLHRGACVSAGCAAEPDAPPDEPAPRRFARCVNATTWARHGLQARLSHLDYCRTGAERARRLAAPPSFGESALAAAVAALLLLAALSTAYDLMLPAAHPHRHTMAWALAWSVPGAWRSLTARPPPAELDLSACDGLRTVCMLCIIIEHVCWLGCTTYVANPRFSELTRRAGDAMLMANSTLVVQVFFVLSSFLLANKLLLQRRRGPLGVRVWATTLLNRFIRISPGYWLVLWYAGAAWARGGDGPLWAPLVEREAAVCRRKWWAHMLYVNNVVQPDDKCLIQTWYLAADMQLYALGAALTLLLTRCGSGRRALAVLGALWALAVAAQFVAAYAWRLQPNFVIHRPEAIRALYAGDASFNWLYQSPLGNATGCLTGLLLAFLHRHLADNGLRLADHKVWAWASRCGAPLAVLWVAASPLALGAGRPGRLSAAALAALERPVFAALAGLALLGAFHEVHTPWRAWLSWRGWALPARLSFLALQLHMLLDKALVAARLQPTQVTRAIAIHEWWGVAVLSYAAALPLALLVEVPAVRLHRALSAPRPAPPHAPAPALAHDGKRPAPS